MVLALLLAPQPDGNVNNPLRSARPDWDVVVIDQACARRLSTLDAEIVAARNELKAVRKEIEQVAEENALVMGAMIQMGSDPEPLQMRDGLTKTLQALVQGQPSLHLLDVNCETAPCIGVLWEKSLTQFFLCRRSILSERSSVVCCNKKRRARPRCGSSRGP